MRGIAKYSRLHGPWRFFRQPPTYIKINGRKEEMRRLKNWGAHGIIARDSVENIKEVIAMGLPTIIASSVREPFPGLPSAVDDCVTTGKMVAEYLLDRGFRQFAYCGIDKMPWSQKRGESFAKTLAEAGFKTNFYKQPKSQVNRLWENEPAFMVEWLKSLPKPAGLMTCADHRSEQIIEACEIAGLRIPDQIAVIGVDNDELICELSNPPLSSVAINFERVGYEAAELLDKLMARKEKMAGQRIVARPTHIVTRQSTDILAIEDHEVANAVQFIRQNSSQVIQVIDVVAATALSRRVLERRFRQILGRPILSEIRRVRVERIAIILVETDQPITQIALNLGYTSIEHIARYFRQEKGMSPKAYRKQYGHT